MWVYTVLYRYPALNNLAQGSYKKVSQVTVLKAQILHWYLHFRLKTKCSTESRQTEGYANNRH